MLGLLCHILDFEDQPCILVVDQYLQIAHANKNFGSLFRISIQDYIGSNVNTLNLDTFQNHILNFLEFSTGIVTVQVYMYTITLRAYDKYVICTFKPIEEHLDAPPTKRLTTLGRKSIDGIFSTEYNDIFKYKYMKINEELSPISYTISEYNPDLQDFYYIYAASKNQLLKNIKMANCVGQFASRDCQISVEELADWIDKYLASKRFNSFSDGPPDGTFITEMNFSDKEHNAIIRATSRIIEHSPAGRPTIMTFYEDVTDKRKLEQEMEQLRRDMDEIVAKQKTLLCFCENAPMQMGITELIEDTTGYDILTLYANAMTHSVLNYPPDYLIGKKLSAFGHTSKVEIQSLAENYLIAKNSGKPYSYEREYKTYSGSRWFWNSLVHVTNNQFVFLAKDITQRKLADLELQQTRDNLQLLVEQKTKQLQEAMEVKSRFLAIMSHEIRTPLSGIMGSIILLEESTLSFEQKDLVHTAQVCGEQLLVVINDILDLTKMEENKMPLDKVPCSLRNIIEESLEIVALSAEQKEIDLIYDLEISVPLTIVADAVRLRQIFVNLLSNSCKFSSNGDVILKARLVTTELVDSSLCKLEFYVQDSGIGIPETSKDKIFQPFYQADSSVNRKYGGSGLGLSISKRLAELHGGAMWFKSQQNKGTTFFFTIEVPYQIESIPKAPMEYSRKVLIIVPESTSAVNIKIMRFKFLFLGVDIIVSNGQQVDDIVNTNVVDIIFVDTKLANTEVLTFLKKFKIPIVLIGYRNTIDTSLSLLKKPIKESALQSILSRHIRSKTYPTEKVEEYVELIIPLADENTRVLVAEDNIMNQLVIKKLLKSIGYTDVTVVENGQKAIEAVVKNKYDIVLMDCMMPIVSGLEATEIIRKTVLPNNQPFIIALTADAFKENANNCIAVGMNDVITKPVNRMELAEKLKKYSYLAKSK